jgi:hypothetical protein
MKTNAKLLLAVALMAGACTTGSKVTSPTYSDDLYYTPGETTPATPKPVKEAPQPQKKSLVAMQVEETEKGKVVNNYVVPKSSRKDNNAYYFDDQPAYSDTVTEYKDNKEQSTVNNYYEGQEMDYATRINNFYDPYFYNPYWDPFWGRGFGYGGWGFGFGMGMGMGGYYNPWYSNYGWGYPYYGWGYPNYGWGYPYSGWDYYGYGLGWGGGGGGANYASGYYGKQNHTGQGGSNAVRYGANSQKSGILNGGSSTRIPSGNTVNGASANTRITSGTAGATSTRLSGTQNSRLANSTLQSQSVGSAQGNRINKGETISNLRRSSTGNTQVGGTANQSGSYTRSATVGSAYTPTYNKPRMNTQASYNNGSSRQYTTPGNVGGSTQSARYGRPQGSVSSSGGSVRTQSSGSYQRGSVSSSTTRSSGSFSSGSSTRSSSSGYSGGSTQSRSYSPSSNSGGGFSGGGASGGGGGGGTRSSGGGGGGGRTR